MKLFLLLFFVGVSAVFADTYSQNTRLSLHLQDVSIEELFSEIEKNSEYIFLYKENVPKDAKISIDAENETLDQILEKTLTPENVIYHINNRQVVVAGKNKEKEFSAKSPEPIIMQKRTISGVVKDNNDEPIVGANVVEKGTTNGIITDVDGNFSLSVNENATILISYIGYTSQEISVGNQNFLSVILSEDSQSLEEVVVVGYGVQKKQTVTAAASVVKMDDVKTSSSTNLTSTLGGRVSGVLIQQASGEAGYENPSIIIRGSSSPTSSSPLIVVDGVIGRSMSQLDPNEVESITVLKDASAVAPYGARGANGVVLVTTKRGLEGKTVVNYSFKGGFGEPTRMPQIAGSYDHARFINQAWRNKEMDLGNDPGMYGVYTEDELQKFRDGSDPYGYPNTNWVDEVLLPRAWQQQHSLTAGGGGKTTKYFMGFGYVDQNALYGDVRTNEPSSGFQRYNVRTNIDANIIDKWLTLSADLALRQEDRNTVAESTSFIFHNMYRNPQTDPGRFPDGKLGKVSLGHNPIGLATEGGWIKNRRSVINTRFIADLKIPQVEGLNFKGIFAFDKTFTKEKKWETPIQYYIWNKITQSYDGSSPNREGSDLTESYSHYQTYTAEFQASYNTQIADDHQLGALFVYTVTEDKSDDFWAARYKYQFSAIDQLFAGPDKDKDNGGEASEGGKLGTVFRLTYNYKEKYMVEANGRIDGSEKFPKNKRYGFFPSVSLGWRISSESFMEPLADVVNNLKLRASWGKAGTDNIGRFRYMSAYGEGTNAVFGGQSPEIAMGYTETRFPNTDITWETSEMVNVGVDASFFQGKLALEADWFYKVTRDILRERTDMPGILGYTLPAANVGVVDNRGIDLNITHRNKIGDFHYSATGNLTWARNKVIELLEAAGTRNDPRRRSTGRPMNQYFGYEALGLFQTDEEADNSPQPQFGVAKAGDIKYKDQNGDGIIDAADQVAIGKSPFPELVYGLNLNLEYKGIDLLVFFQGAGITNYYYDGYLATPYREGMGGTFLEHFIDNTWTPENPHAEFPRLYYGANPNNSHFSSFWLRNASYLRLKNIEIGYNFKKSLLSKANMIQALRISLAAQNLFTWSDLEYVDPELRTAAGNAYPQMKNFTLGVNITF